METATHGVPVLCVPYFLDQFAHCRSLTHRLRMGVYLDSKGFTKDSFERGIQEVMENKTYKMAAEKAKYIIGDVPALKKTPDSIK